METLKKVAVYFNVTTDYPLEISDVKREGVGTVEMDKMLEEYYNLIKLYRGLERCNQEIVLGMVVIIIFFHTLLTRRICLYDNL